MRRLSMFARFCARIVAEYGGKFFSVAQKLGLAIWVPRPKILDQALNVFRLRWLEPDLLNLMENLRWTLSTKAGSC